MRAVRSHEPGGPETLRLEDIPEPEPGPEQVRIAVRAAALNFPDLLQIQDLYQGRMSGPSRPDQRPPGSSMPSDPEWSVWPLATA